MDNKKFYLLVGLLGLIAALLAYSLVTRQVAFGAKGEGATTVSQGVSDFTEISTGGLVMGQGVCTIPTSTTTCSIINRTATTMYVEYVGILPRTTASSTMVVFTATSTAAQVGWPDFVLQGNSPGRLPAIASTTIATGTQPLITNFMTFLRAAAGTTTSLDTNLYRFNSSNNNFGWYGAPFPASEATSTTFQLRSNEAINFVVQAPNVQCASGQIVAGHPNFGINCDSATSTNRVILDGIIRYTRFKGTGE